MTKKTVIPFYEMGQLVKILKSKKTGKICGIRKLKSHMIFYVAGDWYKEDEIEKVMSKKAPTFFLKENPIAQYAYLNMRTTKIDHYSHEWAGNQFTKRAPQFDIPKRS